MKPLAAAALLSLLCGCASLTFGDGGLHQKGDRMFVVGGFTGEPIVGKALAWVGEGDVPNKGIIIHNYVFLQDRVAIGAGIDLTQWNVHSDRVPGFDIEGKARYYFVDVGGAGIFGDFNAGVNIGRTKIPPDGSRKSYSFAFGLGAELPFDEAASVLVGGEFHHISNARGRYATDNPSQNEGLFWVGVGFRW